MHVHEAVAQTLRHLGIDTAFGLIGSGNYAMVSHMTQRGIRYYGSRFELAAMVMADTYARLTGTVGVCTVHQGPGLTNTVTGLAEAVKNRTPLVLLAGDTPTMAPGGNLDIDQDAIAQAVGAGVQRIRAARTTVEDVARAVRRAQVERRPIVLSVPVDLQEQTCEMEDPAPILDPPIPRFQPSGEALAGVAGLIQSASRPLILAGRGAVLANAGPALEALGERIGALMATTAQAHGLFAGGRFGVGISGGFSSPLAVRMIGEADLILAFGASLTYWTTKHGRLLPPVPLVQCDVEPTAIGARRPVDVGLLGDAAETASALLDELVARDVRGKGFRTDELASEIAEYRREDEFEDQSENGTIDPRTLMVALEPMLPRERTVAMDSGHFMGFPAMYLSVPDAAGFVLTQAFQAVGIGLATGIGAAVARPDRLAVAVLGDGGLRMSLGEIDTAVAHRLPILIVVVNDAAYGAEVHHFLDLGFPTEIAQLEDRDFAAIARAMGAKGHTVRSVEDLKPVADWLESRNGPMLLDCKVNPRVRAEWLEEAFRLAAA
jgi:thiamine pyrophosphate-dependent acetolactate synthase large subunit-like protein